MGNITLSVDEKVLAVVRRHPAEQNSSVNALVRDYSTNLATQEYRATGPRAIARIERSITRTAWQKELDARQSP
jgi:hypothetical protein